MQVLITARPGTLFIDWTVKSHIWAGQLEIVYESSMSTNTKIIFTRLVLSECRQISAPIVQFDHVTLLSNKPPNTVSSTELIACKTASKFQNGHACSEHTGSVHSANVPNKAAKASVITHSIIVSRILYALPACGGFLTVELKNRINAFFKRLRRFGYINCVMTIDHLIERSDYELFTKVCSGSHSLYHLLPSYHTSDLRLCGHPFQLPDYYTDLHKKSFIVRSLYEYIK